MIGYDGIATCSTLSLAIATMSAFSLSVWFKTQTAAVGAMFGWKNSGTTRQVAIRMNSPSAGHIQAQFRQLAGQIREVDFDASSAFNGLPHHLLITRSGSTVAIYLDGVAQALNTTSATLTTQNITTTGARWATGALADVDGQYEFGQCDLGEFAHWARALAADEAVALAAGISPLCMDSSLQSYWSMRDLPATFGGGAWANTGAIGTAADPHIISPEPPVIARRNPLRDGGYDLHMRTDRPAVAGDLPLARLGRTEKSAAFSIGDLPIEPGGTHFLTVIPFTAAGHGDPISQRFVADDKSTPELRPSPVNLWRVTAKAGGAAVVEWTYSEPGGIARADTFSIEVTSLTGGAPIVVDDVEVTADSEYAIEFSGPDGDYRVKVYAKRGGLFESAVTGLDVRLDGTPPVGAVPAMTAF